MDKVTLESFKKLFQEILAEAYVENRWSADEFMGDEIDHLNQEKETQLDLRLKTRNTVFLKKVKKALKKIEEGTFGECEDCGAEIALPRLIARPTAEMCIHCKEEQEKFENQTYDRNRYSARNTEKITATGNVSWGKERGDFEGKVVLPNASSDM